MNIGEAARLSGVSAKMVRHYESLGLLPAVARSDSGYRQYGDSEVHTLRFIKRARELGFSMEEITALLGLWRNRRRASANVRRIAQKHADDLGQRIEAMQAMRHEFNQLLVALGATSVQTLKDGEMAKISRGYRRWLAGRTPLAEAHVQPKKFYYALVQNPHIDGSIGVATCYLDEHPLQWVREKAGSAAVVSFFCEISEEVYDVMRNNSPIIRG